jgi:hypothetical protein
MAGSILVDDTQTNLTGYSVQEDATPLDPSDTTGGVGQIDFETNWVRGPEGSVQLPGLDVELRDAYRGTTYGNITDAGLTDNEQVGVTASGRLGALVGTVSAKPMVDTLQNIVLYYLSLAGITDGIVIDPDIAFLPVAVPGFNDDLWLRTKQLVSVAGCEITLVSNKVVVRPVRSFESDTSKQTDIKWSVSKGDAAQAIEVTYYENLWVGNDLIYPYTDDERANAQSWQVDESAILEDDVQTTVSIGRVVQPIVVDFVPQDFGREDAEVQVLRTQSVYSVFDADNNPVTAQNWRNNGGKIEVTINDDTMSFHVKITAATGVGKGPYRIVGRTEPSSSKSVVESDTKTDYGDKNTKKDNVTTTTITGINSELSDDSEDYPSFFLVGDGVWVNPKVLTIPTGVTGSTSVNEVGTTVQVPSVTTIEDAYRVGLKVGGKWSGSNMTLSGTLTSINRISGSGSILYRSIGDFNADSGSQTIAKFNSDHAGQTVGQFNAAELAKVKDTFDNQVFGNVAGARLKYGDAYYRIDTATVTDADISFTASADTTIADFNDAFAGATLADFNTRFAGKSFKQFNRVPLTQAPSTGTIYVPPVPTLPYPDTFYPDQLYPAADPSNLAHVDDGTVDNATLG